MNKRIILVGSLLFPCLLYAQTPKTKTDSVPEQDLSLVGVIDAATLDNEAEDAGGIGAQQINTTVLTSHDVYLNKAGYQLSPMRFRVRGYRNNYEQTYINGMPFNDQLRGVFNYAAIGAMNSLTRNGDKTNYSQPGAFTFGTMAGANNIFLRAGDFGRGGRATLSLTNRNYYLRGMVQLSSGMSEKGWAVTALVGGRYSHEGVVQGTFYRNLSYALLVEKQLQGGKHRFNLATFGSPVVRGQQNGSMQEVYDLRHNNLYNSNWGYQDGKKRNARVVSAFDPTTIFNYEGRLNDKLQLHAGASFHYGKYGQTGLNWYDAMDPRPDYYRYLPSYFYANGNQEAGDYYADLWRQGNPAFTQVNWDNMINANRENVRNGDGSALYMVEERRSDLFETTINSVLRYNWNAHNKLTAGANYRNTVSHQFKTVNDLLGAKYVLDIDKYADTDYPGDIDQRQRDLLHPNRRVVEGGIFDYDFLLHINSGKLWLNNEFNYGHWQGYYGAQVQQTGFFRDGKMQNGHHPDNSYGVSKTHHFTDYMLKAGATYKINGSHVLQANAMWGTMAPMANEAYISPRYSDAAPDVLQSSKIFHVDAGYMFSTPKLQGRVSVFNTNFLDLTQRSTYYYDGVTMVNQVLTGVNKVHRGVEAAVSYKLDEHWSFDLAGTVAQYYYTNNPMGQFSTDNGKDLADYNVANQERVYMKHVFVGGVPQIAGTFGIRYFIKYWFLGANINGFGHNYIEASPARRVSSRYAGNAKAKIPAVTPDNEYYPAYLAFTHQERFGANYTIDLSIGKMFFVGHGKSINFNLALNNITNRKNIKTGGYEQARIDLKKPSLFKNKYFYMQGFNFFFNISYKF